MKNTYLLLLIISLFYSCENETNSNQILSPNNISSQFFQIDIASDTIIRATGGTVLEISKNTFASNSGSVKLEIKEVLTKSDIIQSGLFTVTENNEILESDGMLYLNVEPKQEPLKDIKVKMPTTALNPNMQLFELGDDKLWKNPQALLNTAKIDSFNEIKKQEINQPHHGSASMSVGSSFNEFYTPRIAWLNIDCLLSRNDISSQKIESFEVELKGASEDSHPLVLLILEKKNVVLNVYGKNDEGNFIFPKSYKLILPKEEATIVVLEDENAYASKKIIIGDTNFHTLKLEPKSEEEFSKLIKNL